MHTDDNSINNFFAFLLYKTNKFHVTKGLFTISQLQYITEDVNMC